MKLNAQVVAVESASKFTDGKPRVTVRIEGADAMYREIHIPVDDYHLKHSYQLDAALEVFLSPTLFEVEPAPMEVPSGDRP